MTGTGSKVLADRKAADPHASRLLGLLSPRDYRRLRPHLHGIALKYRQSLYRAHKPIEFVYFIETGVGSLVNTMANGQAAEVGTIGNEGLVGLLKEAAQKIRKRRMPHGSTTMLKSNRRSIAFRPWSRLEWRRFT